MYLCTDVVLPEKQLTDIYSMESVKECFICQMRAALVLVCAKLHHHNNPSRSKSQSLKSRTKCPTTVKNATVGKLSRKWDPRHRGSQISEAGGLSLVLKALFQELHSCEWFQVTTGIYRPGLALKPWHTRLLHSHPCVCVTHSSTDSHTIIGNSCALVHINRQKT